MRAFYTFIYAIIWPFFNLVHPNRTIGREHIPEGSALVCSNHTALSDPVFLAFALQRKNQIRPMAKAELLRIPILGWILKHIGVFGVERGKSDVGAIKHAMKLLKEGEKVLLFPEGHRLHQGRPAKEREKTEPPCWRSGAAFPSLPVYIPEKKNWFRRTTIVIGKAYYPEVSSRKGTMEEYDAITADLMARIQSLEAQAG